jgi:lysophospholipase L1-like esterase
MSDFATTVRESGARTLATFGDSITFGMSATTPERSWASLLAVRLDCALVNKGIPGTVMQNSPAMGGAPRPNNGWSRHKADLLGAERADCIAILYGFNDARYVGAPETFSIEGFIRDYRDVLGNLVAAGIRPEMVCLGSPPHIPNAGFAVGSEGFTGQTRERFQAHVEAVEAIARQFGVFHAPVNERMGTEGGDALVSDDMVHPNDEGHAKIAEIFAAAERLAP